jgi:hypothetical protein
VPHAGVYDSVRLLGEQLPRQQLRWQIALRYGFGLKALHVLFPRIQNMERRLEIGLPVIVGQVIRGPVPSKDPPGVQSSLSRIPSRIPCPASPVCPASPCPASPGAKLGMELEGVKCFSLLRLSK